MEEKKKGSVELTDEGVVILDQSLLPGQEVYRVLDTLDELCEAIVTLRVRGAPAIGIFAGYALFHLARRKPTGGEEEMWKAIEADRDALAASRPTAVNLCWALDRVFGAAQRHVGQGTVAIVAAMEEEAKAIHQEDIAMCRAIAEHGLSLLKAGDGILTHCNAGPLATSQYGTALGPILLGHEQGVPFKVFADETRPLLQGARLSSYELFADGVDTTVICDNMASQVMKDGKIQAIIAGADRIAANGDAANKIGTSGVAILAKYYGIPFYIAAPRSTIDMTLPSGALIPIEQRKGDEVTEMWYKQRMAPEGVGVFNPAFDVTPHELITAIITECGGVRADYGVSIAEIMKGYVK